MHIGINAWTFDRAMPLAEMVETARRAGFQTFEPTLEADGECGLTADEPAWRRIGQTIRDAGLQVSSLACGLFMSFPYTSRDPAVRQKAHDITLALLDRAAWVGAPVVMVIPGLVARAERGVLETPYQDAQRYALEVMQTLCYEAEARNVQIAVENAWTQFLISPVEMREFLDRVNSGWIGAYLDIGNVMRYGVPQDWIETLGRRILRVHVKDFQLKVGNSSGYCPIGDGDVDWPAVIAALRTTRYDGPLTCEGKGDPADMAARLRRVLDAAAQNQPDTPR